MAAPSLPEAAFAAGSKIGRYFGLVSAVPSALLVTFVYALVTSGAWTGPPNWDAAALAFRTVSLSEVSILLLISLALALLLHPLQFALIQLLEGYWGTTYTARRLAAARIRHHRARVSAMDELRNAQQGFLERIGRDKLGAEAGAQHVPAIVDAQEFDRALMTYPDEWDRILPTRLGNVLRRHEDYAGSQYGLAALTVYPHLMLAGKPEHVAVLNDNREQLDLAVRLCALSLLAFAIAFVFLVTDGLWLLIAVIPYLFAYAFYRGSIVAAQNYGAALVAVIDLGRFTLYEALHVPLPTDTESERRRNEELMELLAFSRTKSISYTHPADDLPERAIVPRRPA